MELSDFAVQGISKQNGIIRVKRDNTSSYFDSVNRYWVLKIEITVDFTYESDIFYLKGLTLNVKGILVSYDLNIKFSRIANLNLGDSSFFLFPTRVDAYQKEDGWYVGSGGQYTKGVGVLSKNLCA